MEWEDQHFPIADLESEAAFRREAYRYVAEFHQLDQLAGIDLTRFAFARSVHGPVLYAAYHVHECVWLQDSGSWTFHPRTAHRGLVEVTLAPAGSGYPFESVVYGELEES